MISPPVLPRKRQGRVGARRKTIRPKLQPSPQLQPTPTPQPIVPCRPELLPTAILPLGGRPTPRKSRYKLPVYKDLILPSPIPKPCDRPIDTITQANQQPKIEDEPADVDANDPELNMEFK